MPARTRLARTAVTFAVAASALLAVAPARAVELPATGPGYDAAATTHLLALVNAHRAAIGLGALRTDSRLAAVAQSWTLRMTTTGVLAHNDALFTHDEHTALRIATFGENVAYSSTSVDAAHDALMHSPHHLANIETAAFAVAGFAVALDARGWVWVTEDFGTEPRAATAPAAVVRRVRAPTVTTARPTRAVAVVHAKPAPRRTATTTARATPARPLVSRATRGARDGTSARVDAVSAAATVPALPRDGASSRTALALLAGCLAALALGAYGATVRLEA